MTHARLLELVNASDERARPNTVQLSAAGADVSRWLLCGVTPSLPPWS